MKAYETLIESFDYIEQIDDNHVQFNSAKLRITTTRCKAGSVVDIDFNFNTGEAGIYHERTTEKIETIKFSVSFIL